MKKKSVSVVVWLIFAVVALAVSVFALTRECEHTWREPTVVNATCYEDGSKTRVCDRCKKVDVEVLPAQHGSTYTRTDKETCLKTGKKEEICRDCGKVLKRETIKKKDHSYTILVNEECVAATCTKEGKKVYQCSTKNCTEKIEEVVPMLAHTWKDVSANATASCQSPAYTAHKECSVCHAKNEDYKVLAPQHDRTGDGRITCSTRYINNNAHYDAYYDRATDSYICYACGEEIQPKGEVSGQVIPVNCDLENGSEAVETQAVALFASEVNEMRKGIVLVLKEYTAQSKSKDLTILDFAYPIIKRGALVV